jgi:hypothetical protein
VVPDITKEKKEKDRRKIAGGIGISLVVKLKIIGTEILNGHD